MHLENITLNSNIYLSKRVWLLLNLLPSFNDYLLTANLVLAVLSHSPPQLNFEQVPDSILFSSINISVSLNNKDLFQHNHNIINHIPPIDKKFTNINYSWCSNFHFPINVIIFKNYLNQNPSQIITSWLVHASFSFLSLLIDQFPLCLSLPSYLFLNLKIRFESFFFWLDFFLSGGMYFYQEVRRYVMWVWWRFFPPDF